jgi:hypothetical protein
MKNIFILLALLSLITACNSKTENNNLVKQATVNGESGRAITPEKDPVRDPGKDPIPKTITQEEVSRLALLEAKQLLAATKRNKKLDTSKPEETYAQAKTLFEKGEFKQAQITAVAVRHQLEQLIIQDLD